MIDLPHEVIFHLARYLPQHDRLHLAITNKSFYALLQPLLYHVIVVDSSRTSFDDYFAHPDNDWFVYHDYPCEPTVIRTLYSLTRFFKHLIQKPHLAKYIRQLVLEENCPDMPEVELTGYLRQVLPYFSNIQLFVWRASQNLLDSQLLTLFHHKSQLQSLSANFNFPDHRFPSVTFDHLRHLSVSNFVTDEVLNSIDFSQFPSLKSLEISRTPSHDASKFSCRLESCCQKALTSSVELLPIADTPSFIPSLFSSKPGFALKLESLSLKDISLTVSDAICLKNHIALDSLKHLSLDNCIECFFEHHQTPFPSHPTIRRNPPAQLFMDILAPSLSSLKLLKLNLSNELCFNRSTFKMISQLFGLEQLSIHIKMFRTDEPVNLAPLINSLQPHSRSLKFLNICCDLVENSVSVCPKKTLRFSLKSVLGLSMLSELRVLKLPIEHSQLVDFPKMLSSMRKLTVLQLGISYLSDSPSKAACIDCGVNGFLLGNANSLINEGYFACSNLLSAKIEISKSQQYQGLSEKFQRAFKNLRFIRFDSQTESLIYDVTKQGRIVALNSSIKKFDLMIKSVT